MTIIPLLLAFVVPASAQTPARPTIVPIAARPTPIVAPPEVSSDAVKRPVLAEGAAAAPAPRDAEVQLKAAKSRMARFLDGEWYGSWGYPKETWAPTDIHVSQPSQGSDFTVHAVQGHDEPGWDHDLLRKGITVPQYQFSIGRFVDKKRTLAVELNFDHTKYSSTIGQTARVSGTVQGQAVDGPKTLDRDYFRYYLHNGANHILINVVKRLPLIGKPDESLSVAAIAKAGVGFMMPHADNTIMGHELDLGEKEPGNYVGKHHGWWQLDGWTAGLEAGIRVVPVRPFYLEFTDKVAFARMSDVAVYQGTADHDLWMNQLTLSLGATINGRKKAPPVDVSGP